MFMLANRSLAFKIRAYFAFLRYISFFQICYRFFY